MTTAEIIGDIAGIAGAITIIAAVFRLGQLSGALTTHERLTTERFNTINAKFIAIAELAIPLARLAETVAEQGPEQAAWRASAETRLAIVEGEIKHIRERLHSLANTIHGVMGHQAIADIRAGEHK